MAYAEKRGKFWRARWRSPTGTLESMSGFLRKVDAENYGNDREADMRAGRYVDPRAGMITLSEWANVWFPSLDLEPSTIANYRYMLQSHILPAFGERSIAAITPEEVATWERELVTVNDYAVRTAKDARVTLATCLSAAVPKRIPSNPAIKEKAKGRRGVRRIEKAMHKRKIWADPLRVLLFAERCAALSGEDDDLILQVLFGWTGARWGEALALGPDYLDDDGRLMLHTKIYELEGRFYGGHPKDGSIRSVDLPPFLVDLLGRVKPRRCTCTPRARLPGDPPWCRGGEYLFLGANGGHPRRSNYGRRVVRPAADGWYPETTDKGGRSARPVLVDMSQGWPGVPVVPWPPAKPGELFQAPRLAERSRGRKTLPADTPLASWVPLALELTEHGLRHSHQTWMAEDRVADVLRDERMGHIVEDEVRMASAMRDHYTHVSQQMRGEMVDALQRRWEQALMARVDLECNWPESVPRRSSVPILEMFLQPYRDKEVSMIHSRLAPRIGQRRTRKRPLPLTGNGP